VFGGNLVLTGVVISLACYAGWCGCSTGWCAAISTSDRVAGVIYLSIGRCPSLPAVYTEFAVSDAVAGLLRVSPAKDAGASRASWAAGDRSRAHRPDLLVPMVYYYYQREAGPETHGLPLANL